MDTRTGYRIPLCLLAALFALTTLTPQAQAQEKGGLHLNVETTPGAALLTWNLLPWASLYQIAREEPGYPLRVVKTINAADASGSGKFGAYKDDLEPTGLPPGDYSYLVRAVSRDGAQEEASNRVAVTIVDRVVEEGDADKPDVKLVIVGPKDPKFRENRTDPVGGYRVEYDDGSAAADAHIAIDDYGDGHLFEWDGLELSFLEPPDYENPQDMRGRNVYRVRLLASTEHPFADTDHHTVEDRDDRRNARLLVRVIVRNVADITVNICDRTPGVRIAILNKIKANMLSRGKTGGYPDCTEVTPNQMNRLRHLSIVREEAVNQLQANDFADLPNLEALHIRRQPGLSELPVDIFAGLRKLDSLMISNTGLWTLPPGIFDNLDNLHVLNLSSNRFPGLPEGVFDGLPDTVEAIFMDGNFLATVPDDFLDGVGPALSLVTLVPRTWRHAIDPDIASHLFCHMEALGPTWHERGRCLITGDFENCVHVEAGATPPVCDPWNE